MTQVICKKGFTLIELLVVVSVIALLIAILLPVLSSAKRNSQQLISANNMRQLGLAIHMYQDEHDEWFPRAAHGNPNKSTAWIYTLAPYLSDAKRAEDPDNPGQDIWEIGPVRVCPRDPKAKARMANSATSYMANEWVSVPKFNLVGEIDWSGSYNLRTQWKKPSNTYTLFVNANSTSADISADHTHSRSWNNWQSVINDISTDRYGKNGSPDFLEGSSNYLFADNHIEETRAIELKAMIDAGINFSRPPQ